MLARIALRTATIEALKGKTLVGSNVLDSMITALDADAEGNLTTDQQKPFITVYTDAGKVDSAAEPRAFYEGGTTELVIEIGIAATMVYRNEAGDKEVAAGIPATDDAFELYLDVVGRQIVDALSDIDSPWADIWRGLCYRVGKIERARTSSAEGTRLAAQQIKMTVDLVDDPARGETLEAGTPFFEFFAILEASEDAATLAKAAMMRAQIIGTDEPWEAVQRRLGLTRDELLAVGLGPMAGDIERSTPTFDTGTIEVPATETVVTVEP